MTENQDAIKQALESIDSGKSFADTAHELGIDVHLIIDAYNQRLLDQRKPAGN